MPVDAAPVRAENLCRAWPADLKLGLALTAILVVGCLSPEHWPASLTIGVLLSMGHALAGTSLLEIYQRSVWWLSTLVLLGVAMWFSLPTAEAGLWLCAFCIRCGVALLAGLWLMQVLSPQEFLGTLRRWRVPGLLIVMTSFLLRYMIVLWEEHERLQRAQLSRGAGSAYRWQRWNLALERLGLLLLRSLDRSERIHRAMLARGWDGTPRGLE